MKNLTEYLTESKDYMLSFEKFEDLMRSKGYKYDPQYDVTIFDWGWHQHRFYVNDKGEYYKILVTLKKDVRPFEVLPTFSTVPGICWGEDITANRAWGNHQIKIDWRNKDWKKLIVK